MVGKCNWFPLRWYIMGFNISLSFQNASWEMWMVHTRNYLHSIKDCHTMHMYYVITWPLSGLQWIEKMTKKYSFTESERCIGFHCRRRGGDSDEHRAVYVCRTSINIVLEHTTHNIKADVAASIFKRFDRGKSDFSSVTHIWSVRCCLGNTGGGRPRPGVIINHLCWEYICIMRLWESEVGVVVGWGGGVAQWEGTKSRQWLLISASAHMVQWIRRWFE